MAQEWFWQHEDTQQGPVEIDDLGGRHFRGELPHSTAIWREGEPQRALGDVLMEHGKAPPPLPEPATYSESPALPSFLANVEDAPTIAPALVDPEWADTQIHPWRRYFGRMLDSAINGGIAFFAFGLLGGYVNQEGTLSLISVINSNRILDGIATIIAAIPVNALLIGLTGTTIGKWLFGSRVVDKGLQPIGFTRALLREVNTWARLMALGIPVASLFTLVSAYNHLGKHGATPWDQANRVVVLHRPTSSKTNVLIGVGVLVWITIIVGLRVF